MTTAKVAGFNPEKFRKLVAMFDSPYREEAKTAFGLALDELAKEHLRFCERLVDASEARKAREECAHLRAELQRVLDLAAKGKARTKELQDIIDRLNRQNAAAEADGENNGGFPEPKKRQWKLKLPKDWRAKLPGPKALCLIAFWGSLSLAWLIYVVLAVLSVSETGEMPKSWQGGFPLTLTMFLTGGALYNGVIFLVGKYGWEGLVLKFSMLVNGLFILSILLFHDDPWVAYWHRSPITTSPLNIIVYCMVLGFFLVAETPMNYMMEEKRHLYFCSAAFIILGITGAVWVKQGFPHASVHATATQAPAPLHRKHKAVAPHRPSAPASSLDESQSQAHLERISQSSPDSREPDTATVPGRGDLGAGLFLLIGLILLIHVVSSARQKRKYRKALRAAHNFTAPDIHGGDRKASIKDAKSKGWV